MTEDYLFVFGSVSMELRGHIRNEIPPNLWPGGECSITTDDFLIKQTSTRGRYLVASEVDMSEFFRYMCDLPLERLRALIVEGKIYESFCGNNPHVIGGRFPMAQVIYIASPRYSSALFDKVK